MEALGRLLCGLAPWLESGSDEGEEGRYRREYAELARHAIDAGTDPSSPLRGVPASCADGAAAPIGSGHRARPSALTVLAGRSRMDAGEGLERTRLPDG
ncbi:DUF2264 domain-containing protein [Cohnella sp. LGH]|uniref:DUF2264 domain-containing protein n=1 Tax=Cohnella sp. LGH TaxID=1619153 RepID=UPI001ADC0B71|nr:DUF2264 domain-containing protein [Cohnella sp. LGH]QTH41007.1 DUF2264 domain-containing protein [Cohnella sp. LGH]